MAWPFLLLWHRMLRPLATTAAMAVAAVFRVVWRLLLWPVLRGVVGIVAWAWHTAGRVLRLLGRLLAFPFVWIYRCVLTPIGHRVRAVWHACVRAPARAARRVTAAALAPVRRASGAVRRQVTEQLRALRGRR